MSTVKTHVTNVLAKTGSRDRVQAAILARSGPGSPDGDPSAVSVGLARSPTLAAMSEPEADLRRAGQGLRPGHELRPGPDHPRRPHARARADRRGAVAGRARPLPAGRGARLPVGQPGADRAPPPRPRGRDLGRPARPDPRQAQLDLRPRPRRRGPGARHRAAAGGVPRTLPRLPARHHRAGDGRGPDRQVVTNDFPWITHDLFLEWTRVPPSRRAGPVAGRRSARRWRR